MSYYQDYQPMMMENDKHHAWSNTRGKSQGWSDCLRRCPECGYKLFTNHFGKFHCNRCGFEDEQDVSHLWGLRGRGEVNHSFGHLRYGRRSV